MAVTLATDNVHWSSHDLLTRGGMWNYAIGGRGVGKTYDAKLKRTKHFLRTGKQFIYMRRYETEFADKQELFQDVKEEFPGHEIKVEGMRAYIRKNTEVDEDGNETKHPWRLFCFLVALSTTVGKKSVPYPDVDYIVFDEFIIDKGFIRYISNEVRIFLEFYNTVDRFTDRVRVLFLANAISIVNPYFVYFDIKPRKGQRFCSMMDGYHVCEMIESEAYVERVTQTKFGRMIANTEYFDYAVANRFTNDESEFIAPKSSHAVYQYSIIFDGQKMAVWYDAAENRYYVCDRIPQDRAAYVVTKHDQSPDMVMVDRASPLLKGLKRLYMMGGVYFNNAAIRVAFFDLLDYLNLR